MKIHNKKRYRGVVLMVTLLILSLILIIALSSSAISLKNRRASMQESKSSVAFQNAQTGVEIALKDIISTAQVNPDTKTRELDNCENSGKIEDNDNPPKYYIELFIAGATEPFSCKNGSMKVSDISRIRSVGIASGERRAIGADVDLN